MHVVQIFDDESVRHMVEGTGQVGLGQDDGVGLSVVQSLMDEMEEEDEVVAGGGVLEASVVSRVQVWFNEGH